MPISSKKRKKAKNQRKSRKKGSNPNHWIKSVGQRCPHFGCSGEIRYIAPGLWNHQPHMFVCLDNPGHHRVLSDREIARMERKLAKEKARQKTREIDPDVLDFYLRGDLLGY